MSDQLSDQLKELNIQPPEGYMPSALMRILNATGAREVLRQPSQDMGLAEGLPFPFLAIVGQHEMRIALLLSIINPAVGGVLLIGPRGLAKTTAGRRLVSLRPEIEVRTRAESWLSAHVEREGR